jgi:hypothetical protein
MAAAAAAAHHHHHEISQRRGGRTQPLKLHRRQRAEMHGSTGGALAGWLAGAHRRRPHGRALQHPRGEVHAG